MGTTGTLPNSDWRLFLFLALKHFHVGFPLSSSPTGEGKGWRPQCWLRVENWAGGGVSLVQGPLAVGIRAVVSGDRYLMCQGGTMLC